MVYNKRYDGRKFDELRELDAKVGVIKSASGSAMFKIGKTIAYASVQGPRDIFPKFRQDRKKAVLTCYYNMMAFSGSGERVRPGPSRRSKEISMITKRALEPVLDLADWPKAGVDVYIELLQTDAGTRCAGICAAALALADAGFPMKDIVGAVAVGVLDGQVVVDITKEEEDFDGEVADVPVAMLARTGEVTLLQCDGNVTLEQLNECLDAARKAIEQINAVQKKALLEKYRRD